MNEGTPYPRVANRGSTYVYVLPCREEDLLKVGFSRNPVERFRTLHARFFEFFDLERGLLIHADHLRDARRIERSLIKAFPDYQAPAPLVVPDAAAGYTEWYRGASPLVTQLARSLCSEMGFTLYEPLRPWLHRRPPLLSSAAIWSPIPQLVEIGREEAFYRRADHRIPEVVCQWKESIESAAKSSTPHPYRMATASTWNGRDSFTESISPCFSAIKRKPDSDTVTSIGEYNQPTLQALKKLVKRPTTSAWDHA